MTRNNGNRANVVRRWSNRDSSYRNTPSPRGAFKGTPQFTFDDLYISPFTHERQTDERGFTGYVLIERNFRPSGVNVLDEYIQALHAGKLDISGFCARYNARMRDLDGFIFLLTGMNNEQFRNRWMMRRADDLLRYTTMTVDEVARRSGAGTRGNLYFCYERDMNCSPSQRREELRQQGDLDRFRIVE